MSKDIVLGSHRFTLPGGLVDETDYTYRSVPGAREQGLLLHWVDPVPNAEEAFDTFWTGWRDALGPAVLQATREKLARMGKPDLPAATGTLAPGLSRAPPERFTVTGFACRECMAILTLITHAEIDHRSRLQAIVDSLTCSDDRQVATQVPKPPRGQAWRYARCISLTVPEDWTWPRTLHLSSKYDVKPTIRLTLLDAFDERERLDVGEDLDASNTDEVTLLAPPSTAPLSREVQGFARRGWTGTWKAEKTHSIGTDAYEVRKACIEGAKGDALLVVARTYLRDAESLESIWRPLLSSLSEEVLP